MNKLLSFPRFRFSKLFERALANNVKYYSEAQTVVENVAYKKSNYFVNVLM